MPAALTYPGVYIEELPSGVRTITGVATSVTAFVGRALRGPLNEPVVLFSFADFERRFGGLWRESTMSYAVQQFFDNGGGQAVVVRVGHTTTAATADLKGGNQLVAASDGDWALNLTASVDHNTRDKSDAKLFNLTLLDDSKLTNDSLKHGGSGARETFLNLSMDPKSPRFVTKVLAEESTLARVTQLGRDAPADTMEKPAAPPPTDNAGHPSPPPPPPKDKPIPFTGAGNGDGGPLTDDDIKGSPDAKTGIFALLKTDIFNLLCLPPLTPDADKFDMSTLTAAAKLCADRRALLIVDAPAHWTVDTAIKEIDTFSAIDRNHSAIYFPRLRIADPLQENRLETFAPCGVVAGIYARTDTTRGVWKAPAGIDAGLRGVMGLEIGGSPANLSDGEVGQLNPIGINCLRGLPIIGQVVWGARTLEGADVLASQWKYVPVRRLALYIEESLFRGTQWVVFEPNDEPLWAQIRLNVGAFMHNLFVQGAFQGQTPAAAYFVKCDKDTTTQNDIDRGIVNVIVGFAPLKPAEFVVIKIQQMAGNILT